MNNYAKTGKHYAYSCKTPVTPTETDGGWGVAYIISRRKNIIYHIKECRLSYKKNIYYRIKAYIVQHKRVYNIIYVC